MRIFFASAETGKLSNHSHLLNVLQKLPTPNLLVSYYYLRNWKEADVEAFLKVARAKGQKLFLDSGAHTFLVALNLKDNRKVSNHTVITTHSGNHALDYGEDYIIWLQKYHQYFDMIAELDIGQVPGVGYAKIEERRERLCKSIPTIRERLLVVSHYQYFQKEFGDWKLEWQRLLDKRPYLAIGDDPGRAILNEHFRMWKKTGNHNKIHGFAETKMWKMVDYPYYSVDSSSWNIGARFGSVMYFDRKEKKMKSLSKVSSTTKAEYIRNHKRMVTKLLPNIPAHAKAEKWANALRHDGSNMRDYLNCIAFQEAESYLNDIRTARGITFT